MIDLPIILIIIQIEAIAGITEGMSNLAFCPRPATRNTGDTQTARASSTPATLLIYFSTALHQSKTTHEWIIHFQLLKICGLIIQIWPWCLRQKRWDSSSSLGQNETATFYNITEGSFLQNCPVRRSTPHFVYFMHSSATWQAHLCYQMCPHEALIHAITTHHNV